MTVGDLDMVGNGPAWRPRLPPAVAGALAGAATAALMLAAVRPVLEVRPRGTTEAIMVTFDQTGPYAAVVSFADGTRRDVAVDAYRRLWQPDRPVVTIVVTSAGACAIQIGDDVVSTDNARAGRLAQCLWLAPGR
jgi:hypothetical protein